MNSGPQSNPLHSYSKWHRVFAEAVRLVLAPLILFFSGFFTANFVVSGQYTWPRSSRVLALTLTVLILSYEFIYKEQVVRAAPDRARTAVLYSCTIPYLLGALVMVALWYV